MGNYLEKNSKVSNFESTQLIIIGEPRNGKSTLLNRVLKRINHDKRFEAKASRKHVTTSVERFDVDNFSLIDVPGCDAGDEKMMDKITKGLQSNLQNGIKTLCVILIDGSSSFGSKIKSAINVYKSIFGDSSLIMIVNKIDKLDDEIKNDIKAEGYDGVILCIDTPDLDDIPVKETDDEISFRKYVMGSIIFMPRIIKMNNDYLEMLALIKQYKVYNEKRLDDQIVIETKTWKDNVCVECNDHCHVDCNLTETITAGDKKIKSCSVMVSSWIFWTVCSKCKHEWDKHGHQTQFRNIYGPNLKKIDQQRLSDEVLNSFKDIYKRFKDYEGTILLSRFKDLKSKLINEIGKDDIFYKIIA